MLRKVNPGEKLKDVLTDASNWNALVDTALRGQPNRPTAEGGWGGNTFTVVPVRNDSGSAVSRFGILGIDDIIITPTTNLLEFQNNFSFSGITPTVAAHLGKFVVMLDPTSAGAVGSAIIAGATVCQIDVLSANHFFADVKNSDATKLQSNDHGSAKILYKESGTGTKKAVVTLGAGVTAGLIGKTSSSITALSGSTPGSGTVTPYAFNGTTLASVTGDVTVYNNMTTAVDSGKWCQCKRVGAYLWIDVVDCA